MNKLSFSDDDESFSSDASAGGRLARFLAGLKKDRGGALPVQTGFPTSLADLFVKHRGRLKKKPPRPRRKRPPPPPPVTPAAAAAAAPTGDTGKSESLPDVVPEHPVLRPDVDQRRPEGGVFRVGVWFLVAEHVVVLALLAFWRMKLISAVTIAAFVLFSLEAFCRRYSFLVRRPCPEEEVTVVSGSPAEAALDPCGRSFVSPIREVVDFGADIDAASVSSVSICSQFTESSTLPSDQRSDACSAGEITVPDANVERRYKVKKFFKKLFSKTKKKKCTSQEASVAGSINQESNTENEIAEVDSAILVAAGPLSNAPELGIAVRVLDRQPGGDRGLYWLLGLANVVLLGLMEGKLAAVALTMFSFLLITMSRPKKMENI